MVPLDVGSALGGSGEEDFKGVKNIICDPRMTKHIPEGIDKIHCDVALEKALKEVQKALWPEMFPPIEDFAELCKDFNFKSIQEFITKVVKNIMTGGVSSATDAVTGLLGGKKYDKIEPICIDMLLERGSECQCNLHPGMEIDADGSQKEYMMEIFREYPPMLLMPVLDAGLLKLIINMITLFEEESSEDDEIKLIIIWFYLKFKEYMGYQDDTPVPVPNIFSGGKKYDREANPDHYHWYNMEILNAYLAKEGVSVEEFNFIDRFFEFSEIKQRISVLLNDIYDKPLYDRELFDQIFGQVTSIVDGIKENIPGDVDFDLGLDRIIDNFFPAPTCGDFLAKFGIEPDTMTDGGVGWGKATIAGEIFLLQMIKLVVHEALIRPICSEDKTDPIDVGATVLATFIGVIPILFVDTKVTIRGKNIEVVRVVMHIINALVVLFLTVAKVFEFILECTQLELTVKDISKQVLKGIVLLFGILDRLGSVIASGYQLTYLIRGKKVPEKEVPAVPVTKKEKGEEYTKLVVGYIAYDILSLERAHLFIKLIYLPATSKIRKKTGQELKKELRDVLQDFNTPPPSGFRCPWQHGTKQSAGAFYGLTFLRHLVDWVAYEIVIEVLLLGIIPGVIGSGFEFLSPVNIGKRYRDNFVNFFGLFGAHINPDIKNIAVTDPKINGGKISSQITDMGTAEVVDLNIILNWTENNAPKTKTIPNVKEIKVIGPIEHVLTGLNNGINYSINANFKARHRFGGTVEYKVNDINRSASLTTTTMLTSTDATNIAIDSANLNGNLETLADLTEVDVLFELSETSGGPYDKGTTSSQKLTTTGAFSSPISGLSPDTTYYFRIKATIGTENQCSPELSFKTEPAIPPKLFTGDAEEIDKNIATLNGELKELGTASEVDVYFEWGESSGNYTDQSTMQKLTSPSIFDASITGLKPGTTYYFRTKAKVGSETYDGPEKSFDTIELVPPDVITDGASDVKSKSAVLEGNIVDTGSAETIKASFEWGTKAGGPYDNYTSAQELAGPGPISAKLTALSKGKTYYFRVKAIGDGTTYGDEESFTTLSK